MPSISFSTPRFSSLPPFSLAKRLPSTRTWFISNGSSVRFDGADALRFGSIDDDEPSDLNCFFQRVSVCNRGSNWKRRMNLCHFLLIIRLPAVLTKHLPST